MKLAHLAQTLTIALLICTAYLAWQAQHEAATANAKFDRLTKQAESALKVSDQLSEGLVPGLTTPMQMPAAPKTPALVATAAPVATPELTKDMLPPLPKPLPTAPEVPAKKVTATISPLPAAPVTGSAGTPAPSVAAAPTAPAASTPAAPTTATVDPNAPLPLTPLQRRVKDSPSLAKIKEVVLDQGFVTLDAGTKVGLQKGLKFDLRRDSAVVGRISVTDADEAEAVADLDPKSVPAGVTVQAGDELISVIIDK